MCVWVYACLSVGGVYWGKFGSGQMRIRGTGGWVCLTQNLWNNQRCLFILIGVSAVRVSVCVCLSVSLPSVCLSMFVFEAEWWLSCPDRLTVQSVISAGAAMTVTHWSCRCPVGYYPHQTAEFVCFCMCERDGVPLIVVCMCICLSDDISMHGVFVCACVSMTQWDSRAKKWLKRPQLHFHCNGVF